MQPQCPVHLEPMLRTGESTFVVTPSFGALPRPLTLAHFFCVWHQFTANQPARTCGYSIGVVTA